jgi:oligopeptide/dipeptide ABC transporter ATP-binding protein
MSVGTTFVSDAVTSVRSSAPLLEVRGLVKHFPAERGLLGGRAVVHAVDGVDLDVRPGEVLAVVGESGSGKSTLARCVLRLIEPTAGSIVFDGEDVMRIRGARLTRFRQRVQAVFQDPFSSLDPRWRVGRSVREALDAFGIGSGQERDVRVQELLDRVGLTPSLAERRPHELSGGQRQRVGIAAALAPAPDLIVADEPVSALDVSVQAQVLNLLAELQRDLGLAIVFVAHDLAVVEHISHRVAVMYLGKVVELGSTEQVFHDPQHPYTKALLEAIPRADPSRRVRVAGLEGEIPSPITPPSGCRFHTRCPVAIDVCRTEEPAFTRFDDGHLAACHVARAMLEERTRSPLHEAAHPGKEDR